MSTNLQHQQDLPQTRLVQTIKIESLQISYVSEDVFSPTRPLDRSGSRNNEEEDECKTPRSTKNLIPKINSCPPAPKKSKRVPSCKRKLEFFEVTARQEIESFFKRAGVINSNETAKRRRFQV
ncbi:hypothetical protein Leryth_016669 [Lithospermum erythrorhizon]|nr:hypothetical protein Leryth_016669 [Lithospermum erythrorhizon]